MSQPPFKGACDMPMMSRSSGTMEWNLTGSWRYLRPRYLDKDAPCSAACPAGEDIPLVELLASQGEFSEAWHRIREENPLTAVCGRVCYHPCERACNRREYDDALAINTLERHIAEHARRSGLTPRIEQVSDSGRRIAVVGAGPAGLTAAWQLRRQGHDVTLFDARDEAGGMLRYAIPAFRLPTDILAWEVGFIINAGVDFHPGRRLGDNLGWDELNQFDAVFLAIGAWQPKPLGIDGESLATDGLAFLESIRREQAPQVQGQVAVVGGGNTAMDVARTLLRLGAEPTIYYRRRLEDLPALQEELQEVLDEGIKIRPLRSPQSLSATDYGLHLHLTPMLALDAGADGRAKIAPAGEDDEVVAVTAVFTAIGYSDSPGLPAGKMIPMSAYLKRFEAADTSEVRVPVFAGGDLANDNRTVVTAVASGKAAAVAINALLTGTEFEPLIAHGQVGELGTLSLNRMFDGDRNQRQQHVVGFNELNTIYFRYRARMKEPHITLEERRNSFDEVSMRISSAMAMSEAERCFRCGLCDQCDNCYLFCPDMSVTRDLAKQTRDINYEFCKGCGVCVVECPRNAMVLIEEPR